MICGSNTNLFRIMTNTCRAKNQISPGDPISPLSCYKMHLSQKQIYFFYTNEIQIRFYPADKRKAKICFNTLKIIVVKYGSTGEILFFALNIHCILNMLRSIVYRTNWSSRMQSIFCRMDRKYCCAGVPSVMFFTN